MAAEDPRRRGHRRLRAVRARVRLGRRQHRHRRHAAMATTIVLDGEKTWISNGGIADFYVVFARTGEAPGATGFRPSSLPATIRVLTIAERIERDRAASAGAAAFRERAACQPLP